MEEKVEQTFTMNVGYQQLDYSGHWRLGDIFSALSNVATIHAENINLWRRDMVEDYGWVVSKVRIRILKPIQYEQKVHIKTWPGQGSRVIFPRYFTVTDENDERYMEVASIWTLLDLKKRRIVLPARAGLVFPENLNLEVPLEIETDFSSEEGFEFVENRPVRYSDLDTNQHLNNARYIEWVMDVLDLEKFKDHYIDDFSIYFKKETAPGQTLRLEKKEDQNRFFVRGMDGQEVHFIAEGTWKKD